MINKKIAPGTKGQFEIVLETNKNISYQICFENYGEKPQNLLFKIKENDEKYKNLKELEQFLQGNLDKGKIKNITIEWNWNYESNYENNLQDTEDGKTIKEYRFDINVIANEI